MHLSWAPYSLHFKHPFGLSYGTRTTTEVVFVKITCDGFTAYGEASLPPYLGESQESVISFFKRAQPLIEASTKSFSISELNKKIDEVDQNNNAAKAALDIALYDLKGKMNGQPVYFVQGLDKPIPKATSVTISIGEMNLIPEKIKEQKDFEILKIKLGTEKDKEIIERIRDHTDKKLVLDVNQGWKNKFFALEMAEWLEDENILFIEQPLNKVDFEGAAWLKQRSPVPIIADEAFKRLGDLERVADSYHGINIKLMKCTGIYEALQIMKSARELNLKINLGCMSESSCAVSAAAHLMGLADWIDLDGPLLVNNDPFNGIRYTNGKVELNSNSGIGTVLTRELLFSD